jgi:hypothetical protein
VRPLSQYKKPTVSGRNTNEIFFDSPPPLVAFLFLRLVTILFSSTVAVASNVLYFDTPNSDECGTVVLLELPFFSVPKRRYTCYVTPRILDKQNRRQVGTGWVTLKLPGYGC